MRLTSSVKELEAILQKLINLDKIQNENETNERWIGFVGDADELLDEVVGSVQQTTETILVLTRTRINRKSKPFKSL